VIRVLSVPSHAQQAAFRRRTTKKVRKDRVAASQKPLEFHKGRLLLCETSTLFFIELPRHP
jgi:hypothetical protein